MRGSAGAFALLLVPLLAGCLSGDGSLLAVVEGGHAIVVCSTPCKTLIDASPDRAWEPTVAVNPNDPDHIVASANVRAYVDGGSQGALRGWWNMVYASRDGGASWTASRVPAGEPRELQPATRTADPVVLILGDGTVLAAGMVGRAPVGASGLWASDAPSVFVARSEDGGLTWPEVTVVSRGLGAASALGPITSTAYEDKPWLAAGPGGEVLLVWQRFHPTVEDGVAVTLLFARSDDRGRSWSAPMVLREGGSSLFGSPGRWASPVIARDGTYFVAFTEGDTPALAASHDRGASWAVRSIEHPTTWMTTLRLNEGDHGRRLLLVFPLATADGLREVPVLITSEDDGRTWSEPLPLDQPEAATWTLPAMDVAPDGTVYASFYHNVGEGRPREYRVVAVRDGTLLGRLVLDTAAQEWGNEVGHYTGIAASTDGAFAVWVTGQGDGHDLAGAAVRLVAEVE